MQIGGEADSRELLHKLARVRDRFAAERRDADVSRINRAIEEISRNGPWIGSALTP